MRLRAALLLLALLAAPLAAALALWPRHGAYADYGVALEQGAVPCARVVDHDLYFAKRQLFSNPVELRWDRARHGDNREIPTLEASWRARLRVPAAGDYYFRSATPGELTVTVGGESIAPTSEGAPIRLKRGERALSVTYRGKEGPQLMWRPAGGKWRPLGGDDLRLRPAAPWPRTLAIAAFLGLFFVEAVLLARFRPRTTENVMNFVLANRAALALLLLIAAGLGLRLDHWDSLPFVNETADEYNVALNGLNLAYRGVPSSWSQLPAYLPAQRENKRIFGEGFGVVTPYFDHPPGLGLIAGLALRLQGVGYEERYDRFFLRETRPVPIALFALSATLLFFLARRTLGSDGLALLAVAFFALYPTGVLAGRLFKEENVLVPLFLGALLLAARFLDRGSWRALAGMAALAALACLVKVSGLAIAGAACAALLLERRWKPAAVVAGAGLLGFGAYFAYGAAYDWDTFMRVFHNMQTREFASQRLPPLSTRGLWSLLADNGPATTKFGSLTHIWLWWCAAIFWRGAARSGPAASPLAARRAALVVWPLVIYLAFLAITISSDKSFGWYRIPMLPFMAIAAAWCVGEIWREGDVMLAATLCLMPLVDAAYWAALSPATEHSLAFRLTVVGPLTAVFATRLLPERWRKPSVQAVAAAAVPAMFVLMALAALNRWLTFRLEY